MAGIFERLRELVKLPLLLGLFIIGAVFVGAEPWYALTACLLVLHPVTCWCVVRDVLMLLGALQVLHPETAARVSAIVHDFVWPMLVNVVAAARNAQGSLETSRAQWEAMFAAGAGAAPAEPVVAS